jgi:hypothetical protein
MPELPNGLKLAINWGALFDHGGNWFGWLTDVLGHIADHKITRLDAAALDAPDDKAVAVKIGGTRIAKMGKGSTAEVAFEVAPREKWPDCTLFDKVADEADDAPPAPAAPAKSPWDSLEDAVEF